MANHYTQARKVAEAGEVAAVVIHPPYVGTLVFPVRVEHVPFLYSADPYVRVVALLTYMECAHERIAEEVD